MFVALATAASLPELDEDGPALRSALTRAGVAARPVVWDDPAAQWSDYDLVVVRSTWDYVARRHAYLAWSAALPAVANPAAVLAWNTDKRYLRELADAGLPVVPTTWLEPGGELLLPTEGEYVVKPAVSAGSADTARWSAGSETEQARAHASALLATGRTVMVQPYLSAVDTAGETALIYLGGAFSHAVRKGQMLFPGQGLQDAVLDNDDREQIEARSPSVAELALGERVLAAVPFDPSSLLYARVDMVPGPDGAPVLLELELTEPSLFLGYAEGAADHFAAVIAAAVTPLADRPTPR